MPKRQPTLKPRRSKPVAAVVPDKSPDKSGGEWPATVSTKAICEATGWTERWLRDKITHGFIPKSVNGRWPTLETIKGCFRYLKETRPAGSVSMNEAKTRRAVAQAISAEVQAERDKGSVVAVDEARMTFAKCGAKVKTRMLAIPSAVAPKLVGLGVAEMDAKLREHIVDGLTDLDRTRI